jgi:hypothetical protein
MPDPKQPSVPSLIQRLASIDVRSLAAFRIGLGGVLIWDLVTSLWNAGAFYGEAGVLPLSIMGPYRESPWIWSLHDFGGSFGLPTALIVLQLAAAFCLLIGYRTQLVAIVSWALLCSLQARNPVVLHGGDTALRLLLFWGIFLPLGSCWSVDVNQRRIRFWASGRAVFNLAGLGLLFQTVLIYWSTAVLKSGNEWTRDGTAVYFALSVDQFVRQPGLILLQFPELCRGLTFYAWWLEILGPFFVFMPWKTAQIRILIVAAFWALHAGFGVCLRLGPFPFVMMVAWVPFLPGLFWSRIRLPYSSSTSAGKSGRWMSHAATQAFSLFCLVYVTFWNLRTTDYERMAGVFPSWVNPFGYALRLDQYWALFAPKPLTDDGWLVLEATLADGSQVDLLRNGQPVSYEKPRLISAEYPDYKWQKLEINLYLAHFQSVRLPFSNFQVRKWNESRGPHQQVTSWILNYMKETTLLHHYAVKPQKIELWKSSATLGTEAKKL